MILGAILAGGRASRFGADKALAPLAGRPLIEHVAAALTPWVDAIVVCGRRYGDWTALDDRPVPGLGPLGGLNAALHHADAGGFEAVLTMPCDTPDIAPDTLAALLRPQPAAYLSDCPVIGRWPVTLADALDRFIAADERRSLRGWARAAGAVGCAEAVPANVNTPAELHALATLRH